MSSTLSNHQLGVLYTVAAVFGSDALTWKVLNLEPEQRLTACPIVMGWTSCTFVCQSLCALKRATSWWHPTRRPASSRCSGPFLRQTRRPRSQTGFLDECRQADIYDAVALGPACSEVYPAPLQWSVVRNRPSLNVWLSTASPGATASPYKQSASLWKQGDSFEDVFSHLTELHRRSIRAFTDALPGAAMLVTILAMNAWAALLGNNPLLNPIVGNSCTGEICV